METVIREIPQPGGGRVESGPVQFGDDWPGAFIRGDSAGYYAMNLNHILHRAKSGSCIQLNLSELIALKNLQRALGSCVVGPAATVVAGGES